MPVGLSAAVAALVLRALARRRRARRRTARPGRRTQARAGDDIEAERLIAGVADDALDYAWRAVAALRLSLRSDPDPPTIGGILVSPQGAVTVYLDRPAEPSPPFAPGDTPTTWRLPAQLGVDGAADDAGPVLETVVALGRVDDGTVVFVDLESLGAIGVAGDVDHARRLVQSFVAELALQPQDHCVDLTVTGSLHSPANAEQGVIALDRLADPVVRQLVRTARETQDYLAAEQAPTTVVGRVRDLPRDGLVVTVVAADTDEDTVHLDRLADAALPGGHGLAVLTVGALAPPATSLVAHDDGSIEVPHLGCTVTGAALDPAEARALDDLIGREPTDAATSIPAPTPGLATPTSTHRPDGDSEPETASVTASTDADQSSDLSPPLAPSPDGDDTWQYRVRILADHRVEARDGTPVSFRYGDPGVPNKNTTRAPELLAYLTLRPNRAASRDEVRDHLWWGRPVVDRTIVTLLSGARSVLGGTQHLSRATGDRKPGLYTLGPTVVSDVDQLTAALAQATQLAASAPDAALTRLHDALAGIEAPPFRHRYMGSGLADWAAAHRVVDKVEQPVIDAAMLAVDLYRGQDPPSLNDALWAVEQALKAVPTNEALVRVAMQLDVDLGDREAADRRYVALATQLARDDLEPEAETTDLRNRLLRRARRIG